MHSTSCMRTSLATTRSSLRRHGAFAGLKVVFTRHLLYPVRQHFLYKRVDGWIAPTAQILKTLDPLKPKRSAVIPNWVDLERFPYRPHAFHVAGDRRSHRADLAAQRS